MIFIVSFYRTKKKNTMLSDNKVIELFYMVDMPSIISL